jgi:hypothetical protein
MWRKVLFLLAVVVFIVYFATSGGATPYDYFIRLATSFLHGKYYLDANPSWLNELIPITNGKFAVVYPPAPAIVAIPFVLIFGKNFQQQIMSQMMGALAAFVWGLIAFQKSGKKLTSLWVFLLAGLGNIVWFMSGNGSVWYLGQISAYLFLTLTIYESLNKKRIPLLVLYFSLSILSRLEIVLALPLIIYLNRDRFKDLKKIFSFVLGLSFFGIIYGIYNHLRFGSFFQTGYSLVPGILKEPWYQNGLFSLFNIPNHLKIILLALPKFIPTFPFIEPSWAGLAIWITTPAFIYAFRNDIKKRVIQYSWVSIILISLLIFSHGETGFTQFGYRFAVDFYPIILFLIVEALGKDKLKWHHWLLLILSITVNLWGVLWINKFGWVGF